VGGVTTSPLGVYFMYVESGLFVLVCWQCYTLCSVEMLSRRTMEPLQRADALQREINEKLTVCVFTSPVARSSTQKHLSKEF